MFGSLGIEKHGSLKIYASRAIVRFLGDGFLCQDFRNTDVQGPWEKQECKGSSEAFLLFKGANE